jgi:hypothetical protein
MSKLNPTIIKDRKENRIEMACEGHHPFIVQKYHINQHEVASQDTEISNVVFGKILTACVGTI